MAARMTYCGFCRCPICETTAAGPARNGEESWPRKDGPLLPTGPMAGETYCRDCERFYRQLITFERGNAPLGDWLIPDSPAQEMAQPEIAS